MQSKIYSERGLGRNWPKYIKTWGKFDKYLRGEAIWRNILINYERRIKKYIQYH